MKTLFTVLLVFSSYATFTQVELKKIKKEIPVKRIKEIDLVEGTSNLYHYQSKKENGIWDVKSSRIIAKGIQSMEICDFQTDWINISIGAKHIIYDHVNSNELISSKSAFNVYPSFLDEHLIIVNTDVLGIIDTSRNEIYLPKKNGKEEQVLYEGSDTLSWGGPAHFSFVYNKKNDVFEYQKYLGDMVWFYYDLKYLDDNLLERKGMYSEEIKVTNPQNGEVKFRTTGKLFSWDGGYGSSWSGSYIYVDNDFNEVIEKTRIKDFGVNEFERIIGNGITEVKHMIDDQFYVENDLGIFIYELGEKQKVTAELDNIFLNGKDVLSEGYSAYLYNNGKVGYYHTNGFKIEPQHQSIQLRVFEDETYGYKADNVLYKFIRTGDYDYYYEFKDTVKWQAEMENRSFIYNHLSVDGNYLVVSPKRCEPDTHDAVYYTATYYEESAGVYELSTGRLLLKRYHSITPFKGYYIATQAGSSYKNWLKAEIYDQKFNLIKTDELSSPVVYRGKLFFKTEDFKIVEYDIQSQKIIKTVGKAECPYDDYMFYNGYLLMGSANYENNEKEAYDGFEIHSVMTPEIEIIPHKGMGYYMELGDGLFVMGKYVEGGGYGRDWRGNPKAPSQLAIMDIYAGKIISKKWYKQIWMVDGQVTLKWDKNGEKQSEKVSLDKLRDYFK